MTVASFIRRRPEIAPADEYEHPDYPGLWGEFDLEWRRPDRSVGETETGFVAMLTYGRFLAKPLSAADIEQALGRDGVRDWEEAVAREASEQ